MRLILLILLLCSFGADAQMIIKAHANYRPYAQPAANLLLDDYPNAAAAYSLRKLDKDYTGSAIRVRRSNDNAESDIGFTSSGDLDTASLKTFVGSNSAFVTTWYDQSGIGTNALQNTAANQPRIINAGIIERQNGDVCIRFDGTNDWMNNVKKGENTTETNIVLVKLNSTSGQQRVLQYQNLSPQTSSMRIRLFSSNWEFIDYQASPEVFTIATTAADLNQVLLFGEATTTKTIIYKNGVKGTDGTTVSQMQLTSVAETNATIGTNTIGSSTFLNGWMFELIIYNSSQSSNRTGIENNINDYYNIYWNGDFTGILDTYPNSAAAYSLRNLSSTYKGPLIRVRRSNDNAEQDIFGDYYGNLDTVGLKNFVGSNNGLVTTWYDQSGNGRNLTQGTASVQPSIVESGTVQKTNGKPSLLFNNNPVMNTSAFSPALAQPNTVVIAWRANTTTARTNGYTLYDNITTSNRNHSYYNGTGFNNRYMFAGSFLTVNGALTANTNYLFFQLFNTTSSSFVLNGTQIGTGDVGTQSMGGFRLGRNEVNNAESSVIGNFWEIVIYNSNQSSNRTGIENNINTYYSIY